MNVIILTGQTATGKTSYALKLAQENNGELINCDSRQIYKHLDIITGKDLTDKTFHSIHKINLFDIGYYKLSNSDNNFNTKIWLYDIVDPKTAFSSYDYQTCALYVINQIISHGKTPIIVGGTYFYLKHLLYDIPTQTIPPNWELRKKHENSSVDQLQQILKNKSSNLFESLNKSDQNNPQRLIRKIEIAMHRELKTYTNVENKISLLNKLESTSKNSSKIEFIGLKNDTREELHTKIERRVEERVQSGAIQEVEQLLKQGYTESDPGIRTIGYHQIIQYLKGIYTKEKAITEWITKEKQYAKRQETFMKKDININWKTISSS